MSYTVKVRSAVKRNLLFPMNQHRLVGQCSDPLLGGIIPVKGSQLPLVILCFVIWPCRKGSRNRVHMRTWPAVLDSGLYTACPWNTCALVWQDVAGVGRTILGSVPESCNHHTCFQGVSMFIAEPCWKVKWISVVLVSKYQPRKIVSPIWIVMFLILLHQKTCFDPSQCSWMQVL